jgi:hypothetical protein
MQRRSGAGPVKAVVLESFSSILHLVPGPNIVGAGPSGGDRCGRRWRLWMDVRWINSIRPAVWMASVRS